MTTGRSPLPGDTGRAIEQQAEAWLQRQGLKAVQQNYRTRLGEIDLIMWEGRHLVFVEVRYRRNTRFGHGYDTVDARKQAKLLRAADQYLQQNRLAEQVACRFDVVSATHDENGALRFDWIKNAFGA